MARRQSDLSLFSTDSEKKTVSARGEFVSPTATVTRKTNVEVEDVF